MTQELSLILIGIVNAFMGLGVLFHNPRRLINISFCIFVVSIGCWTACIGLLYLTHQFLFNTLVFYTLLPEVASLLVFAYVFPFEKLLPHRFLWTLAPLLLLACIIPLNLFVSGLTIDAGGAIMPAIGPLFPLFVVAVGIYFAGATWLFARNFRRSTGMHRMQMRYLVTGFVVLLGSALLFDALLPAFGVFSWNFLGPTSSIIFVALAAYAIVRHELLDIRVIIRRGLLYGLLLSLVGAVYLVLVGAMGYVFGTNNYTLLGSAVLTAAGVALAMPLITRAGLYKEAQRHAVELEQKVRERTDELRQAQENQQLMMVDISHNLQTPLTVLRTKLETLKRSMADDTEIRAFEKTLSDLSAFTYDLLKLAGLEHGEGLPKEDVNLSTLVSEVVEEVAVIAASSGIQVQNAIASDIRVQGDTQHIREVCLNLASNSIKYMRPSGKKLVFFSLTDAGNSAVFSIEDTGIGISADDLPHIFERFYRVRGGTLNVDGSGLGLAIVKRIVEAQSGGIRAESTLGKGTKIIITFPIVSGPS
jgi:signal transduction histidine kinase